MTKLINIWLRFYPENPCNEYAGIPSDGGKVCCKKECRKCGGDRCDVDNLGKDNCCVKQIQESNICGRENQNAPCHLYRE